MAHTRASDHARTPPHPQAHGRTRPQGPRMSLPHPLWCVITGLREGCNASGFRVVRTHPPGTRGANQELPLVCAGNRLDRTAVTPKNHKATICCPHADYEGRHRTFRVENWTYGNQLDWHSVPSSASVRPAVPIAAGPKQQPSRPWLRLPARSPPTAGLRGPEQTPAGFSHALCATRIARLAPAPGHHGNLSQPEAATNAKAGAKDLGAPAPRSPERSLSLPREAPRCFASEARGRARPGHSDPSAAYPPTA